MGNFGLIRAETVLRAERLQDDLGAGGVLSRWEEGAIHRHGAGYGGIKTCEVWHVTGYEHTALTTTINNELRTDHIKLLTTPFKSICGARMQTVPSNPVRGDLRRLRWTVRSLSM